MINSFWCSHCVLVYRILTGQKSIETKQGVGVTSCLWYPSGQSVIQFTSPSRTNYTHCVSMPSHKEHLKCNLTPKNHLVVFWRNHWLHLHIQWREFLLYTLCYKYSERPATYIPTTLLFVTGQVAVGAAGVWLHLSFLRHLRDQMTFVMTLSQAKLQELSCVWLCCHIEPSGSESNHLTWLWISSFFCIMVNLRITFDIRSRHKKSKILFLPNHKTTNRCTVNILNFWMLSLGIDHRWI